MQLVAMGAQDVFLTGNPQITFFKVVYRRHTNFSKECIKQEFNGNPGFGKTVTCTLARNGDLVQEIYLKATLAKARGDVSYLIKSVEVEIGGQKIDKHYAAWLDIYNELFETNHDYRALMTKGGGATASTVYIPLRFWFNRNAGLALPLIALQYHEVKILVDVAAVAGLTAHAGATPAVANMSLLVNYVYLDTDERRRFAQVSHEYLIEQVQHTGVESMPATKVAGRVDMNFNHPVKALLWTSDKNFLDKVKVQLNGHDRFSEQGADYFHLVQPYECGLGHSKSLKLTPNAATTNRTWDVVAVCGANNPVGMYSFCLKPGEHQPSGSCNFSRIDNARLNYTPKIAGTADNLHLFALNYNVLRIMSGMGGLTYSN